MRYVSKSNVADARAFDVNAFCFSRMQMTSGARGIITWMWITFRPAALPLNVKGRNGAHVWLFSLENTPVQFFKSGQYLRDFHAPISEPFTNGSFEIGGFWRRGARVVSGRVWVVGCSHLCEFGPKLETYAGVAPAHRESVYVRTDLSGPRNDTAAATLSYLGPFLEFREPAGTRGEKVGFRACRSVEVPAGDVSGAGQYRALF